VADYSIASPLPAPGAGFNTWPTHISYGGVIFHHAVKVNFVSEPVPDPAGRSTMFWRHHLTLRAIVHVPPGSDAPDPPPGGFPASPPPSQGTGAALAAIRCRLAEPGQKLTCYGHGFGDVAVDNRDDVDFGPVPRVLAYEPIGGALSARIEWAVTFSLPYCCGLEPVVDGYPHGRNVLSITYDAGHQIDEFGYTKRTVRVLIRVANNRVGDRDIALSADYYRNRFVLPLPEGFTRSMDWQVNPAKTEVQGSIVDTEIPSREPYPNLFAEAAMDWDVDWTMHEPRHRGRASLRGRLFRVSGMLAPLAGGAFGVEFKRAAVPRWTILTEFFKIVRKRLMDAEPAPLPPGVVAPSPSGLPSPADKRIVLPPSVLLTRYNVHEAMFRDGEDSVSCEWEWYYSLSDIVTQSGLWLPLGGDWGNHATGIKLAQPAAAGLRNLRQGGRHLAANPFDDPAVPGDETYIADGDRIIGFCGKYQTLTASPEGKGDLPKEPSPLDIKEEEKTAEKVVNSRPPASRSYLGYVGRTKLVRSSGVAVQRRGLLPPDPNAQAKAPKPLDWAEEAPKAMAETGVPATSQDAVVVSQAAEPGTQFVYYGEIRRGGYHCPTPRMTHYGGLPCVELRRHEEDEFTNANGVVVHKKFFAVQYVTTGGDPQQATVVPDPFGLVDKDGKPTTIAAPKTVGTA